jgi:membrane protease YdiL (CAAX protease family)
MPICRECGLGVPPGYDDCPKCGRPLSAAAEAPPEPEPAAVADDLESFYVQAGTAAPAAATTTVTQPEPAVPFGFDRTVCSVCGRGPAAELYLRRHVGLLIVARFAKVRAPFCREHGQAAASEYLRRTMVEGWWGLFSFFLNWFAIYADLRALRTARRLPEPSGPAAEVQLTRPLPQDVVAATTESPEARAARSSVLRTALLAIGIGVVGLVGVSMAVDRSHDTLARQFAVALSSALLVYSAVSALVISQLWRGRVRPHFAEGSPFVAVIAGLASGAAAGFAVGGLISLLSGHVSSDKNMLAIVFEGDHMQIIVVTLIAVVVAPLVEEMLFRGLLVESLRSRGKYAAILGGAVAFSFWHLRPGSLEYYVLMGFLFGYLYWRFGLAGSMSAHAAFNGVLALLAFIAIGSSTIISSASGVSMQAPAGWREVHEETLGAIPLPPNLDLATSSPFGAVFFMGHTTVAATPGAEFAPEATLPSRDSVPSGATDVRTLTVAGSTALRYTLTHDNAQLTFVVIPHGSRRYLALLVAPLDNKTERDLSQMLSTLKLPA